MLRRTENWDLPAHKLVLCNFLSRPILLPCCVRNNSRKSLDLSVQSLWTCPAWTLFLLVELTRTQQTTAICLSHGPQQIPWSTTKKVDRKVAVSRPKRQGVVVPCAVSPAKRCNSTWLWTLHSVLGWVSLDGEAARPYAFGQLYSAQCWSNLWRVSLYHFWQGCFIFMTFLNNMVLICMIYQFIWCLLPDVALAAAPPIIARFPRQHRRARAAACTACSFRRYQMVLFAEPFLGGQMGPMNNTKMINIHTETLVLLWPFFAFFIHSLDSFYSGVCFLAFLADGIASCFWSYMNVVPLAFFAKIERSILNFRFTTMYCLVPLSMNWRRMSGYN